MVLFGVPVERGDSIQMAFECAKAMVDRRRSMNGGAAFPLQIGIGIAYGSVVASCMGSHDRLNYTVLGDRVNLAARLCAQAGPMEIIVDEAVRSQLGEQVISGRLH